MGARPGSRGGTRAFGHAKEDHAMAYFEFEGGAKGLVDGGRPIDGRTYTLLGHPKA